jgi:hypothetical protein
MLDKCGLLPLTKLFKLFSFALQGYLNKVQREIIAYVFDLTPTKPNLSQLITNSPQLNTTNDFA